MLYDKEMATEILTIENNLTSLYFTAVQEARSDTLHMHITEMMNASLKNMQSTIKLLQTKGYYTIDKVSNDKIAKVKAKYDETAK